MKGTTKTARAWLPFFEATARMARIPTGRVSLAIAKKYTTPARHFETIQLPEHDPSTTDFAVYVKPFLHHLQLIRDVLDGTVNGFSSEAREARAVQASQIICDAVIADLVLLYAPLWTKKDATP